MLAAGTSADVSLKLAAAITIPAGGVLPLPYNVTSTQVPLGCTAAGGNHSARLSVHHYGDNAGTMDSTARDSPSTANGHAYFHGRFNDRSKSQPGTTINNIAGTIPQGYTIPLGVFSVGFTVKPLYSSVTARGRLRPTSVTFAADTIIPVGTVFTPVSCDCAGRDT